MADTFMNHGLGWRPDLPDFRDYNDSTESVPLKFKNIAHIRSVKSLIEEIGLGASEISKISIPTNKDLREDCSPVEDQGILVIAHNFFRYAHNS